MDRRRLQPIYLSVHSSICLSIYMSCSLALSLSLYASVWPSVSLSMRPSLHQSIHPSVRPTLSRPPCYRALLILLLFLGIVNTAGSVPSTGCVLLGTVGWRATLNTNTPPPRKGPQKYKDLTRAYNIRCSTILLGRGALMMRPMLSDTSYYNYQCGFPGIGLHTRQAFRSGSLCMLAWCSFWLCACACARVSE